MEIIPYLIIFLSIFSISQSKEKIIYLIHEGEIDPYFSQSTSSTLSDKGISDCKAAGKFLADEEIARLYFSKKTRQTAWLIGERSHQIKDMVEDLSTFKEGTTESIILKLKDFLEEFLDNNYDYNIYGLVIDDTIANVYSTFFFEDSTETKKMSSCGISKIIIKNINSFVVEYWDLKDFR